ncbi:MAG: hypothetical protein PHR45_09310 [Muribaculaceae bacterium]|nr:hypothetical protein [Muribaculaceae bacterium]
MKKLLLLFLVLASLSHGALTAQERAVNLNSKVVHDTIYIKAVEPTKKPRLTIGGYGEAVMTRNFYSDQWQRYITPENYRNESHGRFDLPHVVVSLGYDFGKGWTMGSEIEFEHGGVEAAVELEADEAGEYETDVERGGEVALEQFWIQKSFSRALNLRLGHFVVPVGLTNRCHMPNEFFTVYRPEGESTILPCTWHETGVNLWGYLGKWRYEAMFIPGLDSERFGSQEFISNGSASPYEFKIANSYAGALRIDNYSVNGLRVGVSGYFGTSFSNSLTKNTKYSNCKGEVVIGSIDFVYNNHNIIARGNFDWAHVNDSKEITQFNKNNMSTASPSPKTAVASDAVSTSVEFGYDLFSMCPRIKSSNQKMYLFCHYEYYDSMAKVADGINDYSWCGKHRVAVGLNYEPLKGLVAKAEYSNRFFSDSYNNEPSISLGIAYCTYFSR